MGGLNWRGRGGFEQRVTGGEWKGNSYFISFALSEFHAWLSKKSRWGEERGEILGTLQDESLVEWNLKFGSTIPFLSSLFAGATYIELNISILNYAAYVLYLPTAPPPSPASKNHVCKYRSCAKF